MKRIIVLFLFSIFSLQSSAQRGGARQNLQRVQAAKVGYITERVALTPEQAERFWPVYNRYQKELRTVRRTNLDAARDRRQAAGSELSEAQSRQAIEASLEMQEERLALKRKYKDEFLRVISAQQLVELYQAEQDFNRVLLQRLRQQRGVKQKLYHGPEKD